MATSLWRPFDTTDNDDWVRAARLKKKAEALDKEAAKKLKEMKNA